MDCITLKFRHVVIHCGTVCLLIATSWPLLADDSAAMNKSGNGTFVSFKDRVLRIQGKGVNLPATNEYDRLIAWRIADGIPIFESVDGGAYQPADIKSLESAKEDTIVTIRKIEDVIIDVKIGVAK